MIFTRLAAVFILFRLSSCQVRRDIGRATNEEYPHQVMIVVTGENHEVYAPCRGSGTLITDQWVLTTAHNFDKDIGKAVSAEVSVPAMRYSAEAASWRVHPTYDVDRALEDDVYDYYFGRGRSRQAENAVHGRKHRLPSSAKRRDRRL